MKWIKYKIEQSVIDEQPILIEKKVGYSEANLAIAQEEAYNGEYTTEDDEKVFEREPLGIEFGGTSATTSEAACKNLGAMQQAGGTFTGNVTAAANTEANAIIVRNIVVIDTDADLDTLNVPAGTIVMVRK